MKSVIKYVNKICLEEKIRNLTKKLIRDITILSIVDRQNTGQC